MEHPLAVDFVRWIVLLPLLGAAVNFLIGARLQREFGKRAISLIGCGTVAAAFALAVYGWATMLAIAPADRFMLDHLWRWIDVGPLRLDIALWLDPLSMVMVLIITGVGGLIHIYSTGYMHEDESYWRFFAWLNLFTFAMLMLVLADNLWLMFVGWEGVGLCSFALIGFWYKDLANTTAGNKAFIVNRVGDWAFVVALYTLFTGLGAVGTSDPGDPRRRPLGSFAGWHVGLLRDVAGHVRHAAAVRGRDRQVGADSASRMAA